jgi:hypothetical protein
LHNPSSGSFEREPFRSRHKLNMRLLAVLLGAFALAVGASLVGLRDSGPGEDPKVQPPNEAAVTDSITCRDIPNGLDCTLVFADD